MSNNVIFISGASRGIGNSLAKYFAEKNYTVIGTSRNDFEFDFKSKNLMPIKLDITSRDDIKNCYEMLKEKKRLLMEERKKLLLRGIKTDVDRKKLIELEAQIKECDDQIATDETHVQEEEPPKTDL